MQLSKQSNVTHTEEQTEHNGCGQTVKACLLSKPNFWHNVLTEQVLISSHDHFPTSAVNYNVSFEVHTIIAKAMFSLSVHHDEMSASIKCGISVQHKRSTTKGKTWTLNVQAINCKSGPWHFNTVMHQLNLFLGSDCSRCSLPLHTHTQIKNKLYKREKVLYLHVCNATFLYFRVQYECAHCATFVKMHTFIHNNFSFLMWEAILLYIWALEKRASMNLLWDLLSRLPCTQMMQSDAISAAGAAEEQYSRDSNFFTMQHHSHTAKRRRGSVENW